VEQHIHTLLPTDTRGKFGVVGQFSRCDVLFVRVSLVRLSRSVKEPFLKRGIPATLRRSNPYGESDFTYSRLWAAQMRRRSLKLSSLNLRPIRGSIQPLKGEKSRQSVFLFSAKRLNRLETYHGPTLTLKKPYSMHSVSVRYLSASFCR